MPESATVPLTASIGDSAGNFLDAFQVAMDNGGNLPDTETAGGGVATAPDDQKQDDNVNDGKEQQAVASDDRTKSAAEKQPVKTEDGKSNAPVVAKTAANPDAKTAKIKLADLSNEQRELLASESRRLEKITALENEKRELSGKLEPLAREVEELRKNKDELQSMLNDLKSMRNLIG